MTAATPRVESRVVLEGSVAGLSTLDVQKVAGFTRPMSQLAWGPRVSYIT